MEEEEGEGEGGRKGTSELEEIMCREHTLSSRELIKNEE